MGCCACRICSAEGIEVDVEHGRDVWRERLRDRHRPTTSQDRAVDAIPSRHPGRRDRNRPVSAANVVIMIGRKRIRQASKMASPRLIALLRFASTRNQSS